MEAIVLDQIAILLTGVIAVWLTQDKRVSWRRWAPIFGLLAQPFWFYAAWKADQWGIFAIATLYTYAWARGVWTHWFTSGRTDSAIANSASTQTLRDCVRNAGSQDREA